MDSFDEPLPFDTDGSNRNYFRADSAVIELVSTDGEDDDDFDEEDQSEEESEDDDVVASDYEDDDDVFYDPSVLRVSSNSTNSESARLRRRLDMHFDEEEASERQEGEYVEEVDPHTAYSVESSRFTSSASGTTRSTASDEEESQDARLKFGGLSLMKGTSPTQDSVASDSEIDSHMKSYNESSRVNDGDDEYAESDRDASMFSTESPVGMGRGRRSMLTETKRFDSQRTWVLPPPPKENDAMSPNLTDEDDDLKDSDDTDTDNHKRRSFHRKGRPRRPSNDRSARGRRSAHERESSSDESSWEEAESYDYSVESRVSSEYSFDEDEKLTVSENKRKYLTLHVICLWFIILAMMVFFLEKDRRDEKNARSQGVNVTAVPTPNLRTSAPVIPSQQTNITSPASPPAVESPVSAVDTNPNIFATGPPFALSPPTQSPTTTATVSPTLSPTVSEAPTFPSVPCIQSQPDLVEAVDLVLLGGFDDVLEDLYGWPMNRWCFAASVTNMSSLFSVQRNPDSADFNENIADWDVSGITVMDGMFEGAVAFNQDVSSWNVSAVQTLNGMFLGASLFAQNLCSWTLPQNAKSVDVFKDSACPVTENNNMTNTGSPFSFCVECSGMQGGGLDHEEEQEVNDEETPPEDNTSESGPHQAPDLDLTADRLPSDALSELLCSQLQDCSELLISTTPQGRALTWLRQNPSLDLVRDQKNIQRFALIVLYFHLNGESWSSNGFWLTSVDECLWAQSANSGPVCDSSRVLTTLILDDNRLSGELPSELSLLSSLSTLWLSKNALRGTIPSDLGSLTRLRSLVLHKNAFTGTVPSELGNLTGLQELRLDDNQLVGAMPSPVCSITDNTLIYVDCEEVEVPCVDKVICCASDVPC